MKIRGSVTLVLVLMILTIFLTGVNYPQVDSTTSDGNPLVSLWSATSTIDLRIPTVTLAIILFVAVIATTIYFEEEKL